IQKNGKQPVETDVKSIDELLDQKLITEAEFEILENLENDERDEALRSIYILSWTPKQMVNEFQTHRGKRITLDDALKQNSVTKLDMFAPYMGRFIEMSTFMILGIASPDGKVQILNPRNLGPQESLVLQVRDLLARKEYFKALKRNFSIIKLLLTTGQLMESNVIDDLETINSFLNSKYGLLGQVLSDYFDLLTILDIKVKQRIDMDFILNQIDASRDKLANALSKAQMRPVNVILDRMTKTKTDIQINLIELLKMLTPILKRKSKEIYDNL
ncbi:hypothetical protein LCGC14_2246820, partial [marine sediment metagenome]